LILKGGGEGGREEGREGGRDVRLRGFVLILTEEGREGGRKGRDAEAAQREEMTKKGLVFDLGGRREGLREGGREGREGREGGGRGRRRTI